MNRGAQQRLRWLLVASSVAGFVAALGCLGFFAASLGWTGLIAAIGTHPSSIALRSAPTITLLAAMLLLVVGRRIDIVAALVAVALVVAYYTLAASVNDRISATGNNQPLAMPLGLLTAAILLVSATALIEGARLRPREAIGPLASGGTTSA